MTTIDNTQQQQLTICLYRGSVCDDMTINSIEILFLYLTFFKSLTRSCCVKLASLVSHQTSSSLRPESHHLWVLADQSDINPIGVVVALP